LSTWKNKVVLVTGGSSGFGWHLARAWGNAGSKPILVARDVTKLSAAAARLRESHVDAETFAADVTSDEQVALLVDHVRSQHGRLDVLINAAGKSSRGRATETTPAQFQDLWELNFLATVRCVQATLPLIRDAHGAIINIGSLASKTAGQFLGAYPASKFPLAAYSQQLRMELQAEGVHVMLVCPGPIRRDDGGQRYTNESRNLPSSAQRPGGGAKLSTVEPAKLAVQVLTACERRQPELIVPGKARWLFAIAQLWPVWGDKILRGKTS
jgi:short-subunit dehydrogenase